MPSSNEGSFLYHLQALWRNRHQVWQRLEENGQITMKVTPSQIEFTLPSPKLGVEAMPVIDPPWEPKFKTKYNNALHERGQVRLSESSYCRVLEKVLVMFEKWLRTLVS